MGNATILVDSHVLSVQVENVPKELKVRKQWVAWRLEERNGSPTKVPYIPRTGRRASTTDLMTWGTFEEALEVLDQYDGVGFVFSSGDPYAGIDLDGCRDPVSGEIEPWALDIICRLQGAYVEASPSGTGVHVIAKGKVPKNGKGGRLEMYSSERFFTVTGHALEVGDD